MSKECVNVCLCELVCEREICVYDRTCDALCVFNHF